VQQKKPAYQPALSLQIKMIDVINFDQLEQNKIKRTVDIFPNIMRCGIFGPSGCGKTNVLLTILMYKVPISAIYLCSKTANQEKYCLLRQLISEYNNNNNNNNSSSKKQRIKFEIIPPESIATPEKY